MYGERILFFGSFVDIDTQNNIYNMLTYIQHNITLRNEKIFQKIFFLILAPCEYCYVFLAPNYLFIYKKHDVNIDFLGFHDSYTQSPVTV